MNTTYVIRDGQTIIAIIRHEDPQVAQVLAAATYLKCQQFGIAQDLRQPVQDQGVRGFRGRDT